MKTLNRPRHDNLCFYLRFYTCCMGGSESKCFFFEIVGGEKKLLSFFFGEGSDFFREFFVCLLLSCMNGFARKFLFFFVFVSKVHNVCS